MMQWFSQHTNNKVGIIEYLQECKIEGLERLN